MKIRLKNTKLVDKNKNVIPFFHVSPHEKIDRFLPLSHFGSKVASDMRSMHFVYQTLGLKEPAVLPKQLPVALLKQYAQRTDAPKLTTYPVYLAMKSPLKIPDLTHHSLEGYYRWFSHQYAPKSVFLTGRERCEGDVVGPARIKYKQTLSDFIFRDPFTQSEQNLKKELQSDSLYSVPEKVQSLQFIPSFLSPVASQMDKKLFPLAEKVALQRMIRYLEGEGYDGFVYQNEYEDKGQNSYIIFRPEQVFGQSEKITEHIVLEKTPEQNEFLKDIETKFFIARNESSPSQRIQNHRQNLKKNLHQSGRI